jgi:hypothetical protein
MSRQNLVRRPVTLNEAVIRLQQLFGQEPFRFLQLGGTANVIPQDLTQQKFVEVLVEQGYVEQDFKDESKRSGSMILKLTKQGLAVTPAPQQSTLISRSHSVPIPRKANLSAAREQNEVSHGDRKLIEDRGNARGDKKFWDRYVAELNATIQEIDAADRELEEMGLEPVTKRRGG